MSKLSKRVLVISGVFSSGLVVSWVIGISYGYWMVVFMLGMFADVSSRYLREGLAEWKSDNRASALISGGLGILIAVLALILLYSSVQKFSEVEKKGKLLRIEKTPKLDDGTKSKAPKTPKGN